MSAKKYTILWLDDEPHYQDSHADTISEDERFHLVRERTVEAALAKLKDSGFHPDLLIWDMILPPGPFDREEAADGLRTGQVIFRIFRERFPNTPAILFTNVSTQDVQRQYHVPDKGSRAYLKRDLLPVDLLEKVEEALGLSRPGEPESRPGEPERS